MTQMELACYMAALCVAVVFSLGVVIILAVRAIQDKSFLELSRTYFPLAVIAIAVMNIVRVSELLHGDDLPPYFMIRVVVVVTFVVSIARFAFVFFDYRGVSDKTGKWH